MRVFISKYDYRMITINEHQFHTFIHPKQSCHNTKFKINAFILINVIFHLLLHVLELIIFLIFIKQKRNTIND
jgi:hypothetical protein